MVVGQARAGEVVQFGERTIAHHADEHGGRVGVTRTRQHAHAVADAPHQLRSISRVGEVPERRVQCVPRAAKIAGRRPELRGHRGDTAVEAGGALISAHELVALLDGSLRALSIARNEPPRQAVQRIAEQCRVAERSGELYRFLGGGQRAGIGRRHAAIRRHRVENVHEVVEVSRLARGRAPRRPR